MEHEAMDPARLFDELPPHREAMARGDWGKALSLLEERAGRGGWEELTPREALDLAALRAIRGERAEAAAILRRLVETADRPIACEARLQLAGLHLTGPGMTLDEVQDLIDAAHVSAQGDRRLEGMAAHTRGMLHWKRSEIRAAGAAFEEARRALEEPCDEEELGKVLDSLAMYHEHVGDREKALSSFCLSLSKKALGRDLLGIAITLGNLGRFHLRSGDPHAALSCLSSDLKIAQAIGDRAAQAVVKINIGQALTDLGRLDEAEKALGDALDIARRCGLRQQEAYALKDLARAVALEGDRARAGTLLGDALAILAEGPPYARAQVLLARGEFLLESEDDTGAEAAFLEARKLLAGLGARQEEAAAIHGLARIAEKKKEWNSCLHFLEEGLNRMSTIAGPGAAKFEKSFSRLHLVSQDRAIPPSIGPYRILERIGTGAFGEVYRGFDTREGASRDDVAIKVLRNDGAMEESDREERANRFRRECEILAGVRHPNIVRLIDAGMDPLPFLSEEFVEGGDLEGLLKGGRPLSLGQGIAILEGILEGLEVLHAHRIVHRDLKPANILLRESGEPVIADFGIARSLDVTALTLQSMVIGTIGYMAPEQLRSEPVDERADIYAVGVMAFTIFTGKLPYPNAAVQEVVKAIEGGELIDIASLRPDLAPPLIDCIRRCLAHDKEKRPRSAREVLGLLAEVPRGGP